MAVTITLTVLLPIQVGTNGVLSFRNSHSSPSAQSFPIPMEILIAPLWTDIDIRVTGQIFYRYSTDANLLRRVANIINGAFSTTFNPGLLFIATWYRVARYDGTSEFVSLYICMFIRHTRYFAPFRPTPFKQSWLLMELKHMSCLSMEICSGRGRLP